MSREELLNLKPGDQIEVWPWNIGLWSVGDIITIWGISEKSINTCGSTTGWESIEDFRLESFRLYKKVNKIPEEINNFLKKVEEIRKNNLILLEKRRIELNTHNKRPF